jgi:hypothetical protein
MYSVVYRPVDGMVTVATYRLFTTARICFWTHAEHVLEHGGEVTLFNGRELATRISCPIAPEFALSGFPADNQPPSDSLTPEDLAEVIREHAARQTAGISPEEILAAATAE